MFEIEKHKNFKSYILADMHQQIINDIHYMYMYHFFYVQIKSLSFSIICLASRCKYKKTFCY